MPSGSAWAARQKHTYNIKEFEIKDGMAKCTICPAARTMALSGISQHARTAIHARSQDTRKISIAKSSTAKMRTSKAGTPGASTSKDHAQSTPLPSNNQLSEPPSNEPTAVDPPPDARTDMNFDDHNTATNPLPHHEEMQDHGEETQGHDEETQGGDAWSDEFDDFSDEEELPAHDWDCNAHQDPFHCDSDSDDELLNLARESRRNAAPSTSTATNQEFYPFPNKTMMATDMLFNSPRMKFSRAQQKAVLSWGKQAGAKDVPSHSQFVTMQQDLLER
ncbi:hypothetical protein HWV62_12032, partial [Athelia sp. TMB]